jgi:hypothetical protein
MCGVSLSAPPVLEYHTEKPFFPSEITVPFVRKIRMNGQRERRASMAAQNYHHLRYFWAVARTGNLTRASADLHLTPQAVSIQIKGRGPANPCRRRPGRAREGADSVSS